MPDVLNTQTWDVEHCRRQFPALSRIVGGRPAVFFDGPAGSQVPQCVIDAVSGYLAETNANHEGAFATSRESDALLERAHQGLADFLGCDDPHTVVFGANMTSLTFALSRAVSKAWTPQDVVMVTRSDHDANVTPWVLAAEARGAKAVHIGVRRSDTTLDMDDLREQLQRHAGRVRLVAVGCASNATGTMHPVEEIVRLSHDVGAEVFLDAVHYAPHRLIDAAGWDCDFLACSAYKFFGPHVGVLWGRRRRLEELPVEKLRPAPDDLPGRWMTGTQNHEGIAGALAAVDYLARLGGDGQAGGSRRTALRAAFEKIERYERAYWPSCWKDWPN